MSFRPTLSVSLLALLLAAGGPSTAALADDHSPAEEPAASTDAEPAAPAAAEEPQTAAEAPAEAATEAETAEAQPPRALPPIVQNGEIDYERALAERVHGDPDAPITLIEYSSLTCPHCATLNKDVLPVLEPYVEAGHLKIIKRDFPIDSVALMASAAARCVPERFYFRFIKALMVDQANWARSSDPAQAVFNMTKLLGMDEATFDKCITDEQLMGGILRTVQEAQNTYRISSTPTVILGDQVYPGARPAVFYTEIIDGMIAAMDDAN